jgi:ATP-binding cassette, subfamily B, bacterial
LKAHPLGGPFRRMFRRRVPFYEQYSVAECGAACLRMVLDYFGRRVSQDELRIACGVSRDGTTAKRLLDVARRYGLNARFGKKMEPEALRELPTPAILHWGFSHFVVLERCRRDGSAVVIDPGVGRRRVRPDELSREFTGVALFFEPGEGFRRGGRRHAYLGPYLALLRNEKGVIGSLAFLTVALQATATFYAKSTQAFLDEVLPRGYAGLAFALLAGMSLLAVLQGIYSYARAYILLHLHTRMDLRMGQRFLNHVLRLPLSFIEQRTVGDLMVRLESNIALRDILSVRALAAILDGGTLVVVMSLLVTSTPRVSAVVLVLAALRAALTVAVRARWRDAVSESILAHSRSQACAIEILGNSLAVKAAGAEKQTLGRWEQTMSKSLQAGLRVARLQAQADALGHLLSVFAPTCVVTFCALESFAGRLTVGQVFGISVLAGMAMTAANSLSETWEMWQQARRHMERIGDVLEERAEEPPGLPAAPRLSGAVELAGVSFRYSPTSEDVVRDVTLTIRPGEFVAVVGASGSGKTTLAKLLVGLYPPTRGRLTFDGLDPRQYALSSVRAQIGSVMQDGRLFTGKIRDNIGGEKTVPLDTVEAAARLAEIHDEIIRMPMGYDTILAEAGANLSGGQRQRLVLAKALVASRPILVLDEATSNLDAVAEGRIQRNLEGLRSTRIVVAHRLSTVRNADRILTMDGGRVVEAGSHEELMRKRGRYFQLVASQVSAQGESQEPDAGATAAFAAGA